jgi:hypothetical protein
MSKALRNRIGRLEAIWNQPAIHEIAVERTLQPVTSSSKIIPEMLPPREWSGVFKRLMSVAEDLIALTWGADFMTNPGIKGNGFLFSRRTYLISRDWLAVKMMQRPILYRIFRPVYRLLKR